MRWHARSRSLLEKQSSCGIELTLGPDFRCGQNHEQTRWSFARVTTSEVTVHVHACRTKCSTGHQHASSVKIFGSTVRNLSCKQRATGLHSPSPPKEGIFENASHIYPTVIAEHKRHKTRAMFVRLEIDKWHMTSRQAQTQQRRPQHPVQLRKF